MSANEVPRTAGPVRRFIKRNLAHVVGWFVVIFAVGAMGMAQALPGINTVDSGDIINGEVKKADIGASAVDSSKVQDGTLTGADIKNGSIRSADIKNGQVRRADLGNNAVNSAKVQDGSLTGADVQDGSLTGADVQDGSLGNADIGNGQVNGAKITDNSITSADIANGQVLNADIGNGQVNGAKITDNSVTGSDIANGSVAGADIANNSLTGSDINEGSLDFGCGPTGVVHSWARVKGAGSMPSSFTTSSTFVDVVQNCSGQSVQVRREATGRYRVRFNGDGAVLAMVSSDLNGGSDDIVTVRKNGADFEVWYRDNGGALQDGWFTILTF